MISVVIVDYNSMEQSIDYISNFVEKVKDIDLVNFIIVDNSVNNDNFELLFKNKMLSKTDFVSEKLEKDIRNNIDEIALFGYKGHSVLAIKSNNNYGFAVGNNMGAKIAKQYFDSSYIIFSNNDLIIKQDFSINTLIEPFKLDTNIAVVGPRIIGTDNIQQSPRKKKSIWSLVILYNLNLLTNNLLKKLVSNIDYASQSKYVYWVTGCFMVVDLNKFLEINMFDESTFLYAEEVILAEKLLKNSYYNYYLNEIEIIHCNGGTISSSFDTIRACKISFESLYYYYKTYIKSSKFELFLAKLTFLIFEKLFPVKHFIKKIIIKVEPRSNYGNK